MAKKEITAEQWKFARAQWQAEPLFSYANIGISLGVSKQAVGKRAKAEGWQKRTSIAEITERAYQAADLVQNGQEKGYIRNIEKLVPVVDGMSAKMQALSSSEMEQIADRTAIDARVAILDRHRTEINGPRRLIYEALKGGGDIEKAKLAKVAADTMKIMQDAERKAWGFDRDGEKPTVTVVIERRRREVIKRG